MKTYCISYITRPLGVSVNWMYGKSHPHVNVEVEAHDEIDALTAFANVMVNLNLEASGVTSEIIDVSEVERKGE